MKFIETVLSIIAFVLFAFCAIVFFVLGTLFGGYVLRYFVYLVCFFVQIFGDYAFVSWVENNETVLYVICCVISALIILLMFSSSSSSSGSYSSSNNYLEDNNASNFGDSYSEEKRKRITFVDASGAYRKWESLIITIVMEYGGIAQNMGG